MVPYGRMSAADPGEDVRAGLRQFTRAYELVEQNFAEPLPADQAIYSGAVQGMLRTLDPHSNFLDPKAYQLLQQDQRGQYYGVGMEINMEGAKVIVTQPFPGSPAHKAGLRRGDVIAAIDGKSAEGLNSAQVADRLKGPKGTPVEVSVTREGVAQADHRQHYAGRNFAQRRGRLLAPARRGLRAHRLLQQPAHRPRSGRDLQAARRKRHHRAGARPPRQSAAVW